MASIGWGLGTRYAIGYATLAIIHFVFGDAGAAAYGFVLIDTYFVLIRRIYSDLKMDEQLHDVLTTCPTHL